MNNKQNDVIKELEKLLEQLKSINLEPKPEANFFSMDGARLYENPVSDVMRIFMDANASGNAWLAKALFACLPKAQTENISMNEEDWRSAEAVREDVCPEGGRLDIVITTNNFVLGVENKIFAGANHNPFKDYEKQLKKRAEEKNLPKLWCITAPTDKVSGAPDDWPVISYAQLYQQALAAWGEESAAIPFGKWHVFYQEFLSYLNRIAHPELEKIMDNQTLNFIKQHYASLQKVPNLLDAFKETVSQKGKAIVSQALGDGDIRVGWACWKDEDWEMQVVRFFPTRWGGESQVVIVYFPEDDYGQNGQLGWFVRAYLHVDEFDHAQVERDFLAITTEEEETTLAFYRCDNWDSEGKGIWKESNKRLLVLDAWPSKYSQEGAMEALEAFTKWLNGKRGPLQK